MAIHKRLTPVDLVVDMDRHLGVLDTLWISIDAFTVESRAIIDKVEVYNVMGQLVLTQTSQSQKADGR